MKLITEINENVKVKVLSEAVTGKKQYFIEGVFLQSNIKNRNGRIYPKEILKREVDRYINEYVKHNRALGELNHPDSPTINLDKVSHLIVSLKEDGDNFIGKAKLLDTPNGNIAKALIDSGVQLGVSSRGMGSLKSDGYDTDIVQDDYYLATAADIVADPSAPDAFVNGIMEGKEWVWNNGVLTESDVDQIQKTASKGKKYSIKAFEEFMNKLQRGF